MIRRYRRKPVVVEAVQWKGQPLLSLPRWLWRNEAAPRIVEPMLYFSELGRDLKWAHLNWWILLENNELVSCSPDEFDAIYEAVEE